MAGEHAMSEQDVWIPPQRRAAAPGNEATMVLPIYGGASAAAVSERIHTAAAETAHAVPGKRGRTRRPDALPSDERNMLIFVSALLAMGTLAIVVMASVGR